MSVRILLGLFLILLAVGCVRSGVDLPTGPVPAPTDPTGGIDPLDGDRTIDAPVDDLNRCYPLLRVESDGRPVVTAWTTEPKGRLVALWQVQDDVGVSGDPASVSASALGDAGRWQLLRVDDAAAVADGIALTTASPAGSYFSTNDAGRRAQLCTIPEYDHLAIHDEVTARDWDGQVGGLLMVVANALELDGDLVADDAGFRGGVHNTVTGVNSPDVTALDTNDTAGSGKGEGPGGAYWSITWGKGNVLGAGGGGNGHNAGGGGGALAGEGGYGGWQQDYVQTTPALNPETRGWPGASADLTPQVRWLLGGGGGAGHGNQANGGDGGNGGGVIVVIVGEIDATGSITADGQDGGDDNGTGGDSDGAGGGGSGGTIWIQAKAVLAFTPSLSASAGDGGDTLTNHGPGGGGGGGRIETVGLPGVSPDVGAGRAGTDSASVRGATDGADGIYGVIP